MNNALQLLSSLRQAGMRLETVYDVGACIGSWSTTVKKNALPDAAFILFEANPAFAPNLKASGFQFFSHVLSNPGRTYVEFYARNTTGDSYYKETTSVYDTQEGTRMPCTTLDALAAEHTLPPPDFIKLDTQGSELDILAGAETLLGGASMVLTECPIVRYNAGAPSIQDYLDFFRSKLFIPITILESHHLENTLVQVDILFMKKEVKEKFLGPNTVIRPFAA